MTKFSIVRALRSSAWRDHAACRGVPLSMFFVPTHDKATISDVKAMCGGCPVRRECLEAELAAEGRAGKSSRYGIRGGLTAPERHKVYRQRQRARGAEFGDAAAG